MLDYLVKVLLFQALFLAIYDLILKRETFFQWNRAYLIGSSALAYLIPVLKFSKVAELVPQSYVVNLPEVMLTPATVIKEQFNWAALLFSAVQWAFWLGVGVASLLFFIKLFKLIRLIIINDKESKVRYKLVLLESNMAFSFFNYIFMGKQIKQDQKEQIITHELVHVKQKHSLDLLFFEFQKILAWFNPFSYLFQHRISELHEFIADSIAIKNLDKANYFQILLSQTFGTHKMAFINPFIKHSIIKKRINMLNKNKSKQLFKLKYLLVIPVLSVMLLYSSCEKGTSDQLSKNEKRFEMLYMGDGINTKKRETKSEKEGYFDMYMMGAKAKGKEISYEDLTHEEKLEYDEKNKGFNKVFGENAQTLKIFENESGSRSLEQTLHWDKLKMNQGERDYSKMDTIPFAVIKKAPLWPDCETDNDPKRCTTLGVRDHVLANFNVATSKNLGLEAGTAKVYVQFTIGKQGTISNVRARGPHENLEKEAIRVINTLPVMTPGEQENGKKVSVKYTLPISFVIE